MAIHRMPAAASSAGAPFLDEREREDQHARHGEEQRRVEDLAALHLDREVLLQHEQRDLEEHRHVCPTSDAVPRAKARAGRFVRDQAAVADDGHARDEAVGEIEIVRREDDDGAGRREAAQPVGHDRDGAIVEPGERLVEQHQPRLVQQRALERQPLPHAARERRHLVVAAVGQARARRERRCPRHRGPSSRRACAKNSDSGGRSARDRGAARARAGRCAPRSVPPSARAACPP